MLLGRFGNLPYKVTGSPLTWKKIWKSQGIPKWSGKSQGNVRENFLGLPHKAKLVVPIFFCSLRSHIICTPILQLVAPPLVEIHCLVKLGVYLPVFLV